MFKLRSQSGVQPDAAAGAFQPAAYSTATADGPLTGFVTFGVLFHVRAVFHQVPRDSAVVAGVCFLPLTVAFVVVGPLVGPRD